MSPCLLYTSQSIAKSKECYVLLRVVRKIAKKKDKCEKQAIDNEFAIELDKDELKLFKGLFAEMFKSVSYTHLDVYKRQS